MDTKYNLTNLATTPRAVRRSNHGSLRKLGYKKVPSGDGSRGMFWKIGEITCLQELVPSSSVEGEHTPNKTSGMVTVVVMVVAMGVVVLAIVTEESGGRDKRIAGL